MVAAAPYVHLRTDGRHARLVGGQATATLGDRLNGIHAEWQWDGSRLTATNDRYGYHPLYWFRRGGDVGVSPSITRLLACGAPRDLDEAALAVFLRCGYFVGDDTPFTAIRSVPPAGCLSWTADGCDVTGGRLELPALDLGRDDALDAYAALFRRAVERRVLDGDNVVALSGGLDSRHILFELHRAGVRMSALTTRYFPPRANDDARVAALLCDRLGVAHTVVDPPPSPVRSELDKHLATGFCTDELQWVLPLTRHLAGRAATVYDGIVGDVLSRHLKVRNERDALFEAGRLEELADDYYARSPSVVREGVLARVLAPDQYRRFSRERAIERNVEELKLHVHARHPARSYLFWNRTRREMALRPYLLSAAAPARTPYLDADVHDLLASLPREVVDNDFHRDALDRAFPEHAGVPYPVAGSSPEQAAAFHRRYAAGVLAYTARRGRSSMLDLSAVSPWLLRRVADGRQDGHRLRLVLHLRHLEEVAS